MTAELRGLSDQQLLQECRLHPWEKRLSGFIWSLKGCASALGAAAAVVFALHLLLRTVWPTGWYWPLLIVAGVILSALVFGWLPAVVDRRRRPYWAELQRRYAGATWRTYVGELDAEGAQAHGPEAAVLLTGLALPGGGGWLVLVRLWTDGTGTVEARRLNPCYLGASDVEQIELAAGQSALSHEEALQVKALAAAGFPTSDLESRAMDGCPARVVSWARTRGVISTVGCNLAGMPADQEQHPAVRLMRLLEDLAVDVPMPPLVFGSCSSSTGQARIDRV